MRIVNTVRHSYLFHMWCPACRSACFSAVAWGMPEAVFGDMFDNHREWCCCLVCLRPMPPIGFIPLDTQVKRVIAIKHLGCVPQPGSIKFIV